MTDDYFLGSLANDAFKILPYIPKDLQKSINALISMLARGSVYLSQEDKFTASTTMIIEAFNKENSAETRERLASIVAALSPSLSNDQRTELGKFIQSKINPNERYPGGFYDMFSLIRV